MIIIILLLGFILRLINLNQSLWLDEAITALAVKNNSYWDLITKFSLGDFHPPLYYVIEKFWTSIFGYSEISLRMPSVLFSVATCYLIYKIGKSKAALFWAINPLAIYYAQEARMYSLVALAITGAVYFYLAKKRWLFLIFLAVALYSDYVPWLLIPVFWQWQLILFLIPVVPLLIPQLLSGLSVNPLWGRVIGGFDFKALPLTLVKFIFGRIPTQTFFALPAIFYLWVLSKSRSRFLWLWLLVPLILGFILSIKLPVFSYFRFLFVLPAFILLLASGAGKKATFFVILISVLSLAVFNLNPNYHRENWREVVKYVSTQPGLVLLPSLAQSAPLQYYNLTLPVADKNNFDATSYNTVYLIRYVQEIFDPQDDLRQSLEINGFNRVEEKGFNGVLVWKYQL